VQAANAAFACKSMMALTQVVPSHLVARSIGRPEIMIVPLERSSRRQRRSCKRPSTFAMWQCVEEQLRTGTMAFQPQAHIVQTRHALALPPFQDNAGCPLDPDSAVGQRCVIAWQQDIEPVVMRPGAFTLLREIAGACW
jgi:hypothetical protein